MSGLNRPTGFLQVDVDGLWAVRACYGRDENDTYESDPCWTEGVPRLTNVFRAAGAEASFFLVGRDLELPSKMEAATALHRSGYELANHSYQHRLGLTRAPLGFVFDDLRQTDRLLRQTGAEPCGFRSPGYDVDARVLRVLRRMGYAYDASMLPTYLGPAMRLADAWLAGRWDQNKRQFGRFAYGRAPRRPYFPRVHAIRKEAPHGANTGLLEIPVGVTPFRRLPLTATSLFPLSRGATRRLFERLAARRRPTLLLLHAIDGVDCTDPIVFDTKRPSLAGFRLSGESKERRLRRIVEEFCRAFAVERADRFAQRLLGS